MALRIAGTAPIWQGSRICGSGFCGQNNKDHLGFRIMVGYGTNLARDFALSCASDARLPRTTVDGFTRIT